jgi:hypothetical protein
MSGRSKPRNVAVRHLRRRVHGVVGACCLSWLAASGARALDISASELPTDTIASRERLRDFGLVKKFGAAKVSDRAYSEPKGIRIGNFLFFPSLGTMVRYDDNIFASATAVQRDLVNYLTPALRIQSSFPRHAFDFSLSGKIVNYAEHEEQNHADVTAEASGALHFDHAHTLSAAMLSTFRHEDVTDPGRPMAAARPVAFIHNKATVGVTRDVGQLYGTVSATAANWDYQDTRAADGSMIDQDARDSNMLKSQLATGYRFSPGYEIRSRVSAIRIWNTGPTEVDRSSIGYEALIGLRAEFNPLLRLDVLGGWGIRDFDHPGLLNLNTYLFEAQLSWLVTQRMTLYGTIGRQMAEPIDSEGYGRIDTRVAAKAEFELLHNLMLRVDAEARESEFFGSDRVDHVLSAGFGLDYHLSDNWLFTFAYDYQTRLSNRSDDEVSRNRISIGAKLRF